MNKKEYNILMYFYVLIAIVNWKKNKHKCD